MYNMHVQLHVQFNAHISATIQGITPNERTFRHLLKFSVSRVNIDHYMGVSWTFM